MADEILIALRVLDDVTAPLQGIGSSLSNFGNIITGIKSGIDLLKDAWDFAVDSITPFIDSASEAELALVGLENVLASTGNTSGITEQQLIDLSSALQDVTRFSDEEIQSAETMLLRFENINNDIFPEAIRLTTDLAASLGIDLTTAARQIGMALDDPEQGIGRLNTQFRLFNDTEMETIKNMAANGDVAGAQALIMERLTEKVGGAAEAFGNTFAGQVDIAKNKLDDIRETIGGALLPILGNLLDWFNTFVDSPAVQNFLTTLTDAISTGDFSNLWDMLLDSVNNIDWEQLSRDFADGLNNINWDVVSEGFGGISNALTNILIEIDWSAVAGAVWESLIQAFTVVIDNGADALIQLLVGVFGDPDVETFQAGVQAGAQRMGEMIVLGLLQGVRAAFAPVIIPFEQFLDTVMDLFGVQSPSTVFFDIGKNIVLGLIGGIGSMLSFLSTMIEGMLTIILGPIQPILDLLGIDLGTGSTTGSHDTGIGGTTGGRDMGTTGTGGLGQTVNNYFYGPVYFNQSAEDTNYDCPSPHPLLTASQGSLLTSGI